MSSGLCILMLFAALAISLAAIAIGLAPIRTRTETTTVECPECCIEVPCDNDGHTIPHNLVARVHKEFEEDLSTCDFEIPIAFIGIYPDPTTLPFNQSATICSAVYVSSGGGAYIWYGTLGVAEFYYYKSFAGDQGIVFVCDVNDPDHCLNINSGPTPTCDPFFIESTGAGNQESDCCGKEDGAGLTENTYTTVSEV